MRVMWVEIFTGQRIIIFEIIFFPTLHVILSSLIFAEKAAKQPQFEKALKHFMSLRKFVLLNIIINSFDF